MTFLSKICLPWYRKKNTIENHNSSDNQKFGTFLGVFVPSILMLFGVIIFLRLGWIVGQVGLSTAFVIITVAALIALITTISMASISTNIEVGKGGVYYLLSRSLGIEVGSAVGIPLFLRQSLTIAFCVIGFAESINDLVPAWSITTIGIWTLGILTCLAYFSVRGALKVQVAIFIAIIASLISLFTGQEIAPMHPESFTPAPLQSLRFWAVFPIFFPAMTGVESSVSLSGDLKNPSRSLPIGTISAILLAYAIYMGISAFLVWKVPMDRLVQDPLIMQDLASIPSLIIVGIWGATLSSALGGLLGAPRTLQAIADDGIVPKIFGKTFGPMNEPRIATLVTCGIALFGTYFGSVNVIAPLLTMISLICYGVLNLSAGIETLMANPSWRPRFRVHWSISIAGAVLCLVTMLMIDAGWALLSLLLIAVLYFVVKKRQFPSSWTDIREGILLFFSRSAIYRLSQSTLSSKSWRPHFLIFTKFTKEHSTSLMKFCEAISQSRGFLTMASFVHPGKTTIETRQELTDSITNRFKKKNIHAFVEIKEVEKSTIGMTQMIEYYGIGPLVPNTIVFGGIKKEDETIDFVRVLECASRRNYNIVIMNDSNEIDLKIGDNRNIDVWWDDEYQDNSELMLVLAYMLQRNPGWKRTRICVKAIVKSESERHKKLQEFHALSVSKRLPLDVEVFVSSNPTEERISLITQFSKTAEIIFVSLVPPPQEISGPEYIQYLHSLSQASESLPSMALVLSSKYTPLDTILQ